MHNFTNLTQTTMTDTTKIPEITIGDFPLSPDVLNQVKKVGAMYINVGKNVIDKGLKGVRTQFSNELPEHDPVNYTGYKNRAKGEEKPMQQEIIVFSDSKADEMYRFLLGVGGMVYSLFPSAPARRSLVYFRYDPENGKDEELPGFPESTFFSLFGIIFQDSPDLKWVQDNGETVDVYRDDCLLVAFGDPAKKYGFKPFKNKADRVTDMTHYAGGVFYDVIVGGDDGVARKMHEFEDGK